MKILSIVLFIVAAVFIFYLLPKAKNKALELKAIATKSIEDLKTIFSQMADTGLEGYREFVEIKGKLANEDNFETPFSKQKVAYCEAKLSRRIEKEEQYKDSEGNIQTKTDIDTEEVFSNRSSEYLDIVDGSCDSKVIVELNNGCNLIIPKTYDTFEDDNLFNSKKFGFNISFSNSNYNVLGYQMEEKTIKNGQNIYVIGESYKTGDEIHITRPADKKKPFIVSTKSKEEIVSSSDKQIKRDIIVGIACAIIGVVLLFI